MKYNVLPPGLVSRFIVRMNNYLTAPDSGRTIAPTYWHDGCVLQIHGHRCLVRGSVDQKRIYIQVQGTGPAKREALAIIRDCLADIHKTIRELKADEMVPIPGRPSVAVGYATLLKHATKRMTQFIPEESDDPIEVAEVLARVDPDTRRPMLEQSRPDPSPGHRPSGIRDRPPVIHFGLITMKEEEFRAVERCFKPLERWPGRDRNYLFGSVETSAGQRNVIVARCLEQGMNAAQQCANDMLAEFDPRWLFLVGIAGGFPASEFTLGDVLLASRIHDFSVTAALEGGGTEYASKGGPVHREVQKLLGSLPSDADTAELGEWNGPAAIPMPKPKLRVPAKTTDKAYYGPKKWRTKVQKVFKANFPAKELPGLPRFRIESVVTGNALVKDTAMVERWKEVARQAAHVEMELGGVYEAAHGKDKPVLSIRGISDIVGFVRASAWTEYACQSAAAFARALIGSGLIAFPEKPA